jgi:hypothetical protein
VLNDSKQSDERVPQSSIPAGSTRAGNAGLNAEQIAFRSCTGIYRFWIVRSPVAPAGRIENVNPDVQYKRLGEAIGRKRTG